MAVKLGNGNWAVKENKLLAYNDNSGRFFNKEFDFSRGSSATYVGRDGLIKTSDLQSTNLVQNGNFSELGSQLITNGDFATDSDWVKTSQVTIENGVANIVSNDGSFQLLGQNNVVTTGKYYVLTYTIVSSNSGSLKFSSLGQINSTIGTHKIYFVATETAINIARNSGITDITIDNVSVKQVDPNNYWSLGTGWSIGENKALYNGVSEPYLYSLSPVNIAVSDKLKITFVLDSNAKLRFVNENGSRFSGTWVSYASGTHEVYLTSSIVATQIGVQADTDNGAFGITNISVQEIKINTPRIDFSDSTKGALLLEGQSTNLLPYSEDFSPSSWQKLNNAFVSATKVISPDGTLNASQIIFDGTSRGRIEDGIGGLTQGAYYTVSVYARVSSGTQVVRFGSVSDFEYTLTTEWQRLTSTEVENDTVGYPRLICNDTAIVEIYGFQLEQNSYATSYIPSLSGSATTRLADVCNNSGSAQDFNSEEGVLYAEISALADEAVNRQITLSDGNNNVISFSYDGASDNTNATIKINGVVNRSFNYVLSDVTQFLKIAIRYSNTEFSFWVNGVERSVNTLASSFTSGTLNKLSFGNSTNSQNFYGNVKDLQVFTEAKSDEFLAALTTI